MRNKTVCFELRVGELEGQWYVMRRDRRSDWKICSDPYPTKRQARRRFNAMVGNIPEVK